MSEQSRQSIADIVLPPAPTDTIHLVLQYTVAAIIVLTMLLVIYRLLYSRRAIATRKLKQQVTPLLQQNKYAEAVYMMAAIVRQRIGSTRLDHTVSLPRSLRPFESRWSGYVSRMQELRYTSTTPSIKNIQMLVSETGFWLRKWP